jgi:hypothetical protein
MNSDSGSSFYFQNVMRNHQLFMQNEYLRENVSRQTNDISIFDRFTEEELFCPNFNFIPTNNCSSNNSDSSNNNLFYQTKNNNNCNNIDENNTKTNTNINNNNVPQDKKSCEENKEIEIKKEKQNKRKRRFNTFKKKPKGRISNELKEDENYNHNPKHPKDALDNLKAKAIRTPFREISQIIDKECSRLDKKYKINKLNNTHKISSNKLILDLCKKKISEILVNSYPRNLSKSNNFEKKYKNKIIYKKLIEDGKLSQSPLLSRILNMTFGEILFKFINDDNFVKNIDPNYNFPTISDLFDKENTKEKIESLIKSLNKLLINFVT